MVLPVDILSYALGLFTTIKTWKYILATFIGVIPFAFIFSYAGMVNIYYQIGAFVLAALVLLLGVFIAIRKAKK